MSEELLRQRLQDLQRECAKLHEEKMMLVQKVAELQNEIFKLREQMKESTPQIGNSGEKDITALVRFSNPDDELLPLTKCACGATFKKWEFNLGVYANDPRECEYCHRRLFFRNGVRVIEVA